MIIELLILLSLRVFQHPKDLGTRSHGRTRNDESGPRGRIAPLGIRHDQHLVCLSCSSMMILQLIFRLVFALSKSWLSLTTRSSHRIDSLVGSYTHCITSISIYRPITTYYYKHRPSSNKLDVIQKETPYICDIFQRLRLREGLT